MLRTILILNHPDNENAISILPEVRTIVEFWPERRLQGFRRAFDWCILVFKATLYGICIVLQNVLITFQIPSAQRNDVKLTF